MRSIETMRAMPAGGAAVAERRTPITVMPSAAARGASAPPIAPAPTIASVCPDSSNKRLDDGGSQRAACWLRISAGSWRAKPSISASRCSAMFGAWLPLPLVTTMSLPTRRGVAMRSMPAPRWCSQRSRGAAARMSSIGGASQLIAAASARSSPAGSGLSPGTRNSTSGAADRNGDSRSGVIAWMKAKVLDGMGGSTLECGAIVRGRHDAGTPQSCARRVSSRVSAQRSPPTGLAETLPTRVSARRRQARALVGQPYRLSTM